MCRRDSSAGVIIIRRHVALIYDPTVVIRFLYSYVHVGDNCVCSVGNNTPTLNRRGATVYYLNRVEIEAFHSLVLSFSVYSEQIDLLLCMET